MANNKISLTIAGLHLLISTSEDEAYVAEIAREIDANVNAVLEQSPSSSVTNAILLCTIDYFDSYKKATKAANNMRAQIKDYMAEAASAKREYDDERRRADELSSEMQALRNHLTRIATEGDSSGVFTKLRDDLTMANNELQKQRKRNAELGAVQKALQEKSDAMNSYISGQDREIARLSALTEELTSKMNERGEAVTQLAQRIADYDRKVKEQEAENRRLTNELNIIAALLEEERSSRLTAPASALREEVPVPAPQPKEEPPGEEVAAAAQTTAEFRFEDRAEIPQPEAEPDVPEPATETFEPVSAQSEPSPPQAEEEISASVAPADNSPVSSDNLLNDNPNKIIIESPYTPPPSRRHGADRDFDDAINLVGDRRDRPTNSRPIQDFDIDIGDFQIQEKPLPEGAKTGEDFNDFKIESDENVLGFRTLRHIPEENRTEPAAEKPPAKPEAKPEREASEEDDAMPNLSWTLDI